MPTRTELSGRVLGERWAIGDIFEFALSNQSKLWTHDAIDRQTGERVLAIALRPAWARDPAVRAEYEFGLDALGRLDHPGILPIRARFVDAVAGELVYITDPLPATTRSLSRLVIEGAVFSEAEIVAIASRTLDAVGHAHARGVIFGNVKPANIIVAAGRDAILLDGLPKPPFVFSSIMQLASYLGKPATCAPELIATGKFDARADIYGVGLVLYECVAGRLPFRLTDNLAVTLAGIVHDPLPPIEELVPDVSPRLAAVIACATAKDPAARYQTVEAMRAELERAQPRHVAVLTRERLQAAIVRTMPSPIAHAFAAIAREANPSAQLQHAVDAAHTTITLVGAIVAGARLDAKLPPIADAAAAKAFARMSLGHWAGLIREGARDVPEFAAFVRAKPGRAIDALVALRNDVRHGATPTSGNTQKLLADCVPSLERLLADLLALAEQRLVVPRALDFVDGAFACDALVFRGGRPPVREALALAQPLTIGRPYLVGTRAIPLAPFVVFATCPTCGDDELFCYESASGSTVDYVSYGRGHALAVADRAPFVKLGLL